SVRGAAGTRPMNRSTSVAAVGLGALALYLMTRRAPAVVPVPVVDTRQDTSSLGPLEPIGGPLLPGANPDNAVTYQPPLESTIAPGEPMPPLPAGWVEVVPQDHTQGNLQPTTEHKWGCEQWPINTFNPECEGVTWTAVRAANIPFLPGPSQDWFVRLLESGQAKGPLTVAERRSYLLDPTIDDWFLFDTRHK